MLLSLIARDYVICANMYMFNELDHKQAPSIEFRLKTDSLGTHTYIHTSEQSILSGKCSKPLSYLRFAFCQRY